MHVPKNCNNYNQESNLDSEVLEGNMNQQEEVGNNDENIAEDHLDPLPNVAPQNGDLLNDQARTKAQGN